MRGPGPRVAAGLAALLLLVAGCGEGEVQQTAPAAAPPATPPPRTVTEPREVVADVPVTREEGEEFARQLEAACRQIDLARIDALIDWETIASKATPESEDEEQSRLLAMQTLAGLQGGSLFSKMLEPGPAVEKSSYEFVRVTEGAERRHVWFRFTADDDVAYHDFEVVNRGGRMIAVDFAMGLKGIPISQSLRKGHLESRAPHYNEYLNETVQISQLVQEGKPHLALSLYKRLPEALRQQKSYLLLRLQVAEGTGDEEEMLEGAKAMEELYPGEIANFWSPKWLLVLGRYDQALAHIDRIEQRVGPDPPLDKMRGMVLLKAGRFEEAMALAAREQEAHPEDPDWHWLLVDVGLALEDDQMVYDNLKLLKTKFNIDVVDDLWKPEYEGFKVSRQGRQLLKE